MKFGGTSVGKPERMMEVATLVTADSAAKIVVLSAVSGTTNALVAISDLAASNKKEEAAENINALYEKYVEFLESLLQTEECRAKAHEVLKEHFEFLHIILKISYSEALNRDILAQGELLSTKFFSLYLEEKNIEHLLLPALDFMTLNKEEEPDVESIKEKLSKILNENRSCTLFVTQGYITRNAKGEIDNLKRGGSDYTASLVAAAIQAEVCEIWTDIDGMHNNDPRIIKDTKAIEQLSFDEAAELAYFGAKILHPASIWPAQLYNVPVRLLNTMQPDAKGTLISEDAGSTGVKAVAAKDNIIAVKIKSSRMLLAYGFLRKVFEIFEKYKTPIDMITTSEVALSLTIDDAENLEQIENELQKLGSVFIDRDQTIVSVVGNEIAETKPILDKLFTALSSVPIRMVSYGGSKHNISILIPSEHKTKALQLIHAGIFS